MGGGRAHGDSQVECTVMVYDIRSGEWGTLPERPVKWFGMALVKNQLTLVGGLNPLSNKATSELAVWESESKQWTFPYPPMDIARFGVATATFNEWMAVAGGHDDRGYLNSVDILNTTENKWYIASSLPVRFVSQLPTVMCDQMRSAVVGDEWYLTECFDQRGTIKKMFAVYLPDLISFRERISSNPWRILPSAPLI